MSVDRSQSDEMEVSEFDVEFRFWLVREISGHPVWRFLNECSVDGKGKARMGQGIATRTGFAKQKRRGWMRPQAPGMQR
jgi:hypothetical protein